MFDFSTVETLTIPEGFVDKITRDDGTLVWEREIEGLPVSYQRVEYIGLDGSQGIWYSDSFADINETILTFAPTTFHGSYISGSYAGSNVSYLNWRQSGSGRHIECYVGGGNVNLKTPRLTADTIYTLSTKADNQISQQTMVLEQAGSVLSSQNGSYTTVTSYWNSLKFGIGCNGHLATMSGGTRGTFAEGECFTGRIYSYQHKRNEVLVHDFVPCYRKSDNVIGMYDIIAKKFYTNAGIGSFTKGADV